MGDIYAKNRKQAKKKTQDFIKTVMGESKNTYIIKVSKRKSPIKEYGNYLYNVDLLKRK